MARDHVWQTDITHLPTTADWLNLAIVIDAYSKRVLSWTFSGSLATDFVLAALRTAIQRRGGRCCPAYCCTPTATYSTPASVFVSSSPPIESPPP